jgi:hypothetical protein
MVNFIKPKKKFSMPCIFFLFYRNFVKSIGFFGVAIYIIRDLASNDLLPME